MREQIVIKRFVGGARVIHAPAESAISLEMLAESCGCQLRVRGDLITISDQVDYRVTGWESPGVLTVQLVEDRRETVESDR